MKYFFVVASLFLCGSVYAQTAGNKVLITNKGVTKKTDVKEKKTATTAPIAQHPERLSALFSGYFIELAVSKYPMSPNTPLFQQFGNIQYHKLPKGGYSYGIICNFSSKKEVKKYLNNIIIPRISTAQIVRYKMGERKY